MNWENFWRLWKVAIWRGKRTKFHQDSYRGGVEAFIRTPWFLISVCYKAEQQRSDLYFTGVNVSWGHSPNWNHKPGEMYFSRNRNLFSQWTNELRTPSEIMK